MEEDLQGGGDNIVTEFATYEDFLDSQVRFSIMFRVGITLWNRRGHFRSSANSSIFRVEKAA